MTLFIHNHIIKPRLESMLQHVFFFSLLHCENNN
uniref:Uncharacterized protein n=1 Tax=Lepeophtheirus salmonis TaxID=72036 RepID=A0A0K2U3T1_LEPSM